MTKLIFSTRFKRMYRKLLAKRQRICDDRLRLFVANPRHTLLNVHPLGGEYTGCFSINVTGDIRAVYRMIDMNRAYFLAVGTHSELYGS